MRRSGHPWWSGFFRSFRRGLRPVTFGTAPVAAARPGGVSAMLARAADGSVRSPALPRGLVLAGPGGAAGRARDLVTLALGGESVTVPWRGALPEPLINGTRATDVDVVPGTDVVVVATRTGFEQLVVLRQLPTTAEAAALKIALPVTARGAGAGWVRCRRVDDQKERPRGRCGAGAGDVGRDHSAAG